MPFPVGRRLSSSFRVIRSLHDLPDHIVHLDGLAGASAAPPGAVASGQNRLLEFAEPFSQPVGDQPPFEDVLGRGFKTFLAGQAQALVNVQFLPGGFFEVGFISEVFFNGFGTFIVVVFDVLDPVRIWFEDQFLRKPTTKGILRRGARAPNFAGCGQQFVYSAAGFQFCGKSSCNWLTL